MFCSQFFTFDSLPTFEGLKQATWLTASRCSTRCDRNLAMYCISEVNESFVDTVVHELPVPGHK